MLVHKARTHARAGLGGEFMNLRRIFSAAFFYFLIFPCSFRFGVAFSPWSPELGAVRVLWDAPLSSIRSLTLEPARDGIKVALSAPVEYSSDQQVMNETLLPRSITGACALEISWKFLRSFMEVSWKYREGGLVFSSRHAASRPSLVSPPFASGACRTNRSRGAE